jgi:hypothetical protein
MAWTTFHSFLFWWVLMLLTHSQKGAEQFQTLIFFAGKKNSSKTFPHLKFGEPCNMPKNQPAIHSCLVVFTDDLRISSHMDALMGDPQVVTITVRQETNGPILDAMGSPFF